jgi:peptide/nickel transport system ATP-binding protein
VQHPAAGEPLLSVQDLSVALRRDGRETPLLRDVALQVAPGEIVGVVGESGAGKSMLGSAIAGLLEPPLHRTGGGIAFAGRRIEALPPAEMRRLRGAGIAMIFQDPLTALNPVFTIGRQLVETIELHTELRGAAARAEAAALLRQVGIPAPEARLGNYPHEFSGGMRQRAVIALALAGRPSLLIADEPTTALDVSIQGQVIALLQALSRARGMAVMLITHDLGVVAGIADRIAVMYAGRVVEVGPVRAVLHAPRHPYTRGLMGAIPQVGQHLRRLPQIPGSMPRPDALPAGCAFAPRCAAAMPRCAERPELPHGAHEAACWLDAA